MKALIEAFRKRQLLVLSLAVIGLLLWTFLPAVDNEFIGYDDPEYVTGNSQVQRGLTVASIAWAFCSSDAANWHPLTWLSHQLDVELFGLAAWGHHFTSILLHAVNGLLLFLLLRRLTGATWAAFLAALLFGLHPLRVESVVWVSERKDVLSGFFFMLTIWAYSTYARARCTDPNGKFDRANAAAGNQRHQLTQAISAVGDPRYLLALGFFVLGLMAKPMLVTVPCVLLLLDYWPLRRFQKTGIFWLLGEKIPFFFISLASSAVTLAVQKKGGAILAHIPLLDRVENALVSYARYLGKFFVPVDLAPFYPPQSWPATAVLGSVLLLAVTTAVVFSVRKRFPFMLCGWLWFLVMLVPVVGLVPAGEQSMADRYSYLPMVGLALLVVWTGREFLDRRGFLQPAALSCLVVVTLLILTTRRQLAYWRNTETLFAHALQVTRLNYLAHNNLGSALDRQGRHSEAEAHFEAALQIKPGYVQAHNNLGVVLVETGRFEAAVVHFQQAIVARPTHAEAFKNLGVAFEQLGRTNEALQAYSQACTLQPGLADAHYNLGLLLMRQGRFEEAIPRFQTTIALQDNSPDACNNLGFALQQIQQLDQAIAHYRRAIQLKPDHARAHFNLGVALYEKGLVDAAIAEFNAALQIQPDYSAARKNLNSLLELKKTGLSPK